MTSQQPLHYSLRQIEIFLAIAQHQTTAAAADQLALSQSAVSAALKALESAYGIALFDRVGKRLVLNGVGEHLRQRAEALLVHAREFEAELSGHEQIGDLVIGASYTIANHLAVDYLAQWLSRFPDARVNIATGNSPDILNQVVDFRADIGMIENEISHPKIELIPWLDDELLVFCSPAHPFARKRKLSESDLSAARWILREKDSGGRQRFDQAFAPLLPNLQIYLEFRHNEPIRRAVEQGLGIGCLSEKVLKPHFDSGALVPLNLDKQFRMQRKFFLCLRRGRYQRSAIAQFVALCLATNSLDPLS